MTVLDSLKINNYFTISSIILVYQVLFYTLALLGKYLKITSINNFLSNNDIISFILLPTILIIVVVLLIECNSVTNKEKVLILIVKRAFLIGLLFIPTLKLNLKNFALGTLLLLVYYIFSDIDNVYGCNIKNYDLFKSFLLSSFIYFGIYLIK